MSRLLEVGLAMMNIRDENEALRPIVEAAQRYTKHWDDKEWIKVMKAGIDIRREVKALKEEDS